MRSSGQVRLDQRKPAKWTSSGPPKALTRASTRPLRPPASPPRLAQIRFLFPPGNNSESVQRRSCGTSGTPSPSPSSGPFYYVEGPLLGGLRRSPYGPTGPLAPPSSSYAAGFAPEGPLGTFLHFRLAEHDARWEKWWLRHYLSHSASGVCAHLRCSEHRAHTSYISTDNPNGMERSGMELVLAVEVEMVGAVVPLRRVVVKALGFLSNRILVVEIPCGCYSRGCCG